VYFNTNRISSNISDGNNGVFEVELDVPHIGDAAKYLIEQKVLDGISLDTEIKLAPQNLNFVQEQIISTTAVAPFAKSVSEFWIQIQQKQCPPLWNALIYFDT
jgi:hypothetical protein